jgi:hypothetical protein
LTPVDHLKFIKKAWTFSSFPLQFVHSSYFLLILFHDETLSPLSLHLDVSLDLLLSSGKRDAIEGRELSKVKADASLEEGEAK